MSDQEHTFMISGDILLSTPKLFPHTYFIYSVEKVNLIYSYIMVN